MKKLLLTTAAMLCATGALAQEITVGAANVSSYLDPRLSPKIQDDRP